MIRRLAAVKKKILQEDSHSQFLFNHLMCRYCHYLNQIQMYIFPSEIYGDTRTEKRCACCVDYSHFC